MYNKKHLSILPRFTGNPNINNVVRNVAFYGDKVVATDSFRLVEMLASGEHHEPKLYPANLIKAIKIPNDAVINESSFGIPEVTNEGNFPEYEKLQANWDKEECIEFAVNGDYLAEIVSQLGKLSKYKQVIIKVPKKFADGNPEKTGLPIKIKAPDITAYLMPMKIT